VLEAARVHLPDFEGSPAVLGAARDVTERKKLQQRLLLADRMASVGTLAAGVAHEINNPLSFVLGNLVFLGGELDDLEERLGREPVSELRRALQEATQGAERVRVIVRDLHTFSRADEAQRGLVDVHKALDSSASMAGNVIRHRGRLVKAYGDAPCVLANEARLGQVFLNLLVNAAHALPEGHTGRNEVRVVTRRAGEWVAVEVRDNGCGIPAQHLRRIFDPFFTTKPVGQGTGLGLSICHGIVASLGGRIEVESEVGVGTTFRVLLPAAREEDAVRAAAARPAPAPASRAGPRGRVWVLDDELHVGALVRRLLGTEHEVLPLTSAREVLERVGQGERFDVLLCDLMMPEMSGMDVHARLERASPELAGRVLFMTGGAFTPATQEFLSGLPAGAYLAKPFDADLLRTRVGERLARR
jgi:two-component system cell cycle sensor histidine kinase/response regulator CckA